MANYFNPYDSIPDFSISITSKDIEEVLLNARRVFPDQLDLINDLLNTNSEISELIDNISDKQAYELLCSMLEKD